MVAQGAEVVPCCLPTSCASLGRYWPGRTFGAHVEREVSAASGGRSMAPVPCL